MSLLKDVKKTMKSAAKISMYGAGGVALGWPLVVTAYEMSHGATPALALSKGVKNAIGYDPSTSTMNWTDATNAMWRTGFGAAAIYIAKKL